MRGYGGRRPGAGIVPAGGASSRMGTAKASLDWHGAALLTRTVAVLGRAVDGPLVVVRAAGQELPELPPGTEVVDDPVPGLGPLPAIGAGLAAVAGRARAAFVASTDLPLLHPAFVARVLDLRGDHDVALPEAFGHHQPLAAAYATALAPVIDGLTAAGQGRPPSLFDRVAVCRIGEQTLRSDPVLARLDPDLASLTNVNTPAELAAARARPLPAVRLHDGGRVRTVRARTAGELGRPVVVAGGTAPLPPWFPLVTGDELEGV
ncbi:molybdenum cofactor guanylyltransferase [Pseudonocardia sp. ICBG601]|uniref:molybdenum cofactor guanylyltransferase n=1 Tax=Pseudonocardia sp. ICBG601 TaxID=2846759 RepID=UPI001CF63A19|nr:NTP transferase domain-containing protein [Pseudonocardia sp. ICBG601]